MAREFDSEPCADQAQRMARLGFELMGTYDPAVAVWRRDLFEIVFPAKRAFRSDGELCGVLIEQAIQAGVEMAQADMRRTLGIKS